MGAFWFLSAYNVDYVGYEFKINDYRVQEASNNYKLLHFYSYVFRKLS